jgi:hypothetical protein
MPKPGDEGEQAKPDYRASRAPCAMIVTMAYDEDLANRIRELIAPEDGYPEQKMFGGIGQSVAFARALPPNEKK